MFDVRELQTMLTLVSLRRGHLADAARHQDPGSEDHQRAYAAVHFHEELEAKLRDLVNGAKANVQA